MRGGDVSGMRLHTFGHGTLTAAEFAALLDDATVRRVVDVRAFPGSRRNPQYGADEMSRWLPAAGIDYVSVRRLGGRRRPRPNSKNVALRNDAFRGYADYMETEEFRAGIEELLTVADDAPTTVMCSESVWWRCHRRLLADHLVLVRQIEVVHLMHDGRVTRHAPTQGVRLDRSALVYDVGSTPTLSLD
jgi:uncharacterized protein (DUF488 family)